MDKILIVIFSVVSFFAVFFAIVFEGRIKKKSNEKDLRLIEEFKKEYNLLKPFAWIIIAIAFFMNLGNAFLSIKSMNENKVTAERDKEKYQNDSTNQSKLLLSSYEVNKELRIKKTIDSIEIADLKKLTKENGLKSDLINKSVVENAVNALNEQRLAIEKERENVFKNLQVEVAHNLLTIFTKYEKTHILGFIDTTAVFISTRLQTIYISKYYNFSQNAFCINQLKMTEEVIKSVNEYADYTMQCGPNNIKAKGLNIRMFLNNVEVAEHDLLLIFYNVNKLNSYKEYEALKNYEAPTIEIEKLKKEIIKSIL